MTRQEYDILREHSERLAKLDETVAVIREQIAALPGVLSDVTATKVSEAVTACRKDSNDCRARVDTIWAERQEAKGVRNFWATMGKILAAACAGAGLIATLTALLPH